MLVTVEPVHQSIDDTDLQERDYCSIPSQATSTVVQLFVNQVRREEGAGREGVKGYRKGEGAARKGSRKISGNEKLC